MRSCPKNVAGEKLTLTRAEEVQGQQTQVGVENVYQYEPKGVGGCVKEGCVGLISSGTSAHESAFLDASETGDEAFFIDRRAAGRNRRRTPTTTSMTRACARAPRRV